MFPSPDRRIHCSLESTTAHPKLAAGIPPFGLLSPHEQARFEGFSRPKRRHDWLLGRWTAKHLVQSYLALAGAPLDRLDQIEILAGKDGAPYVQVGGRLPLSLSISHSGSESLCAICADGAGFVGADIERPETRDLSFVRTFFTSREMAAVAAAPAAERDALITALWSAKEAVLKALRIGLRADSRQVEVSISSLSPEWRGVAVTVDPALLPSTSATVTGWCMVQPSHVLSLSLLCVNEPVIPSQPA